MQDGLRGLLVTDPGKLGKDRLLCVVLSVGLENGRCRRVVGTVSILALSPV